MAEDLRVQRTKKAIKTAFIELVNEEGFADVTIKGIAEKAIINRQTFYNYYQDKYDLTEHLNNEYLEILKKVIQYRVQEVNHHGIYSVVVDQPKVLFSRSMFATT